MSDVTSYISRRPLRKGLVVVRSVHGRLPHHGHRDLFVLGCLHHGYSVNWYS